MIEIELGEVQTMFATLVWENEPLSSGELVKLCKNEFNWKKSTTYTVLRKLCEKGILKNENGTVSSIINKQKFYSVKSEKFVDDTFDGSLPKFIAAFMSGKKISAKEADEIQSLIEKYKQVSENE